MTKQAKDDSERISFVKQTAPITERGRAMYAVTRSILRAFVDQVTPQQLTYLNTDRTDVKLGQLAMAIRLRRDKGMRGDGFEWAIHEAIRGGEPTVVDPIVDAMKSASPRAFKGLDSVESLLFGYERAKYLGFLDAAVQDAAEKAVILPDTRGRPPTFENWVPIAAQGQAAESQLGARMRKVWKTDIFLSDPARKRHLAASIKSNAELLEGGAGLRIGIVPEKEGIPRGVKFVPTKSRSTGLWVVTLADPDGFMGLYDDAYGAVAEAMFTIGQFERGDHWWKPSPMGVKIQKQLEKFGNHKVSDVEDALNDVADQDLVGVESQLVPVDAPPWLRLGRPEKAIGVVAPMPSFIKLD